VSERRKERDKIIVNDLLLQPVIGVYDEERKRGQNVVLTLTLWSDLQAAGKSDDLADTVDYGQLADEISDLAEGSSFNLLEGLAEEIAARSLAKENVARVRVSLKKPAALPRAESAEVEINRG